MLLIMQVLEYDVFEPMAIEFCARVSPVILNEAVLFVSKYKFCLGQHQTMA